MCQYCEGNEEVSYMSTRYMQLLVGTSINNKRALIAKFVGCPKYADCSQKDMNILSLFEINYCPNCGRRFKSCSETVSTPDGEVVEN